MHKVEFTLPKFVNEGREDLLMKVNEGREASLRFPTFEAWMGEILRNHIASMMKIIRIYEGTGTIGGKKYELDLKVPEGIDMVLRNERSGETQLSIPVGDLQLSYIKRIAVLDRALGGRPSDEPVDVADLCRGIIFNTMLAVQESVDLGKMAEEARG